MGDGHAGGRRCWLGLSRGRVTRKDIPQSAEQQRSQRRKQDRYLNAAVGGGLGLLLGVSRSRQGVQLCDRRTHLVENLRLAFGQAEQLGDRRIGAVGGGLALGVQPSQLDDPVINGAGVTCSSVLPSFLLLRDRRNNDG